MALKLHVESIPGNLFFASTTINQWGWAEYLVTMDFIPGGSTIAVFKMPAAKVHEIRANNPSYISDPHHDDYTGPADAHASDYRLSQVLSTVEHKVAETDPPKQEQASAVSSPTNPPAEETKQTRKKPQPKLKQAEAAGGGDAEQQENSGQVASSAGAAERAQSGNLPDWAK